MTSLCKERIHSKSWKQNLLNKSVSVRIVPKTYANRKMVDGIIASGGHRNLAVYRFLTDQTAIVLGFLMADLITLKF